MFTILAGMALAATDVAPVARAFGAREAVSQISLSPDGTHVAIVAPSGRGEVLEVADLVKGGEPVVILRSTGDPDRLSSCDWSTDTRLVCNVYMSIDNGMSKRLGYTRLLAVDSNGQNLKVLSAQSGEAIGFAQQGGTIIDMSGGPGGGVLKHDGKQVTYVEYRGLDHYLLDATARAELLAKSDAFLRASLGL